MKCICIFPILAISCLLVTLCYGQDINLQNLKGQLKDKFKDKPFAVHGGFNINSVYTYSADAVSNQQPFTYVAGANVQFKVYSWSLPFTFTYSNKQFTHTNPNFRFNRLSLRPHYKKLKAYIGDFTLSFSPYSLSGFLATGAAVEYSPGKFQVQALYGRFLKAVAEDTVNRTKPSYRRMGWGVKSVYQHNKKKAGISVFHARDELYSIPPLKETNRELTPREGTVVTMEGEYPVSKKLIVQTEFAASVVTQDLSYQSPKTTGNSNNLVKKLVGTVNATTAIYHAVKAGLHYTIRQSTVGLSYERIDPGYQTLGSYYSNNDFENMTINLSHALFKGKINFSANAGLQRDDLAQAKQSRMKRVVFSGNINARPGKKTNISLNYSSFQSFTTLRTGFENIVQTSPYENMDSLNFVQLSQNAALQVSHQLVQRKEQSQTLALQVSYTEAANKKGNEVYNGDVTRLITGNANYSFQFIPQDFNVAASCMYTWNYSATASTYAVGPGVTIAKSFFKKVLRANAGVNYNTMQGSQSVKTGIWNVRSGASATIMKKHSFNINFSWQKRSAVGKNDNQFFNASAGYNYNF